MWSHEELLYWRLIIDAHTVKSWNTPTRVYMAALVHPFQLQRYIISLLLGLHHLHTCNCYVNVVGQAMTWKRVRVTLSGYFPGPAFRTWIEVLLFGSGSAPDPQFQPQFDPVIGPVAGTSCLVQPRLKPRAVFLKQFHAAMVNTERLSYSKASPIAVLIIIMISKCFDIRVHGQASQVDQINSCNLISSVFFSSQMLHVTEPWAESRQTAFPCNDFL